MAAPPNAAVEPTSAQRLIRLLARTSRGPKRLTLERSAAYVKSSVAKAVDGAIREHLAPVLRDDGFVGSGRNFRRVNGPIIHVINVQGSMYSKMFAMNLGLHLSFLPGPMGRPVDPNFAATAAPLCRFSPWNEYELKVPRASRC